VTAAVGEALAPVVLRKPAASGRGGAVATQNGKASRVALEVLDAGGNAVDAAVAAAFALGVVEPWMSGPGGIGCGLVFDAASGRTLAVDFGARASRHLDPAAYALSGAPPSDLFPWPGVVGDRNLMGPLSIAVPADVAGLGLLHARFGSLPWRELLQPAVALARQGLVIDWYACLSIAAHARELRQFPSTAAVFLPDGLPPRPDPAGGRAFLSLPELADTLERLAAAGWQDFYRGDIARELLADLAEAGSPIAADDLEACAPRLREPLVHRRRDRDWCAMPGLFAGATLVRTLEHLEGASPGPAAGDPGGWRRLARGLLDAWAERLATVGDRGGEGCTSHLCVVDAAGNMVSLTRTLLSVFGSRLLLPRTGILANNGIYWFDPRPGGPNSIAPGKRPLSNMCPVIVAGDGTRLAIGASGGRRILAAVLQIALFATECGMDLEEAFHAPRIDVSGGAEIAVDPRLPTVVREAVAAEAPVVDCPARVFPLGYACPTAVLDDRTAGRQLAAAEPFQPWATPLARG
jgi:gamma-glutamyltranspeptidase/glutathione hydrolase